MNICLTILTSSSEYCTQMAPAFNYYWILCMVSQLFLKSKASLSFCMGR